MSNKLLQGILVLLLILLLVVSAPAIIWILRLLLAIALAYLAWQNINENSYFSAAVNTLLAVIFQPIWDIDPGQTVWLFIKIGLLVWLLNLILKGLKN